MRLVGMPAILVGLMPLFPAWTKLKGVAHTLRYDAACMGDTQAGRPLDAEHWGAVGVPHARHPRRQEPPVDGQRHAEPRGAPPDARRQVLEGQTHMVKAKVVAPVLERFFASA
jgi:hypothetical protein